MARSRKPAPAGEQQASAGFSVLKFLTVYALMFVLFCVIWACLNYTWGAIMDHWIAPAAFEKPCQLVAKTTEPLTRYEAQKLGRHGKLLKLARCHFSAREVIVYDPQWSQEFSTREFLLIVVLNIVGLLACIVGAFIITALLYVVAETALDRRTHRR